MKDWYVGPVYYLLKFATFACLVLLGSVFVSLVTTHGGLHAHHNNINCAIQCIRNPLKQSIPIILEQKTSCLTEKEQLEESLNNCTRDLKNTQDNYTTQAKELTETKEEKDSVIRERDQLGNDCKQNFTNATKEKDEALSQKVSCLSEKGHLQGNLTSCKQNSIELKIQLDDAVNKSERLATYVEHLRLLEVIDNHTRELQTCRVWLKEYCILKNKSSSLDEFDNHTMNNFAEWLGCEEPLPDGGHYDKILPSFTRRVKSILEVREKLEQMLIKGDFKAMKNAQDGVKNSPSEKCNFLCTYTEDEENKESDHDPSSSFGVKALEAGWNIFTRVWWLAN